MNELITNLTDWIPWSWLENLVVVGIYLGLLAAMAVVPLLAWLGWAMSSTGRREDA
ncbi:MAG TPA: hypothetical protein VF235_06975 [Actinomycetota bacterium]